MTQAGMTRQKRGPAGDKTLVPCKHLFVVQNRSTLEIENIVEYCTLARIESSKIRSKKNPEK